MVQMWIIASNIPHLFQNLLKKLVLDYLLGSNKETEKCDYTGDIGYHERTALHVIRK